MISPEKSATFRDPALDHGGDLGAARRLFPQAPEPWLDLSTGINPVPYPLPDVALSAWMRLPGAEAEHALLAAARAAYRVPAAAEVVAAPGTQVLISLLPRLLPEVAPALAAAGRVAVLGPTYAEHAAAWSRTGLAVAAVATPEEAAEAACLVVVNPNNPDGRLLPPERLSALAAVLARRSGVLVVDEAFADLLPGASLVPSLPPAALVLRSFGKAFGLAGLRLGFAIAEPTVAAALRTALGPWAVSGPALAIGAAALADAAWLEAARRSRGADAARLAALLARRGTVVGGTPLYQLLRAAEAPALFSRCGRAGIFLRRFPDDPSLLRFGLPAGEEAWQRLQAALDLGSR